jgi:TonB family protein
MQMQPWTQENIMEQVRAHLQMPRGVQPPVASRLRAVLFGVLGFLAISAMPMRAQDRRAVQKVPPIYPAMARQLRITGVVKVVATVNASGAVIKAESNSGNKLLANSAIDAVKQWKFAPGDGIETVTVDVNFEI